MAVTSQGEEATVDETFVADRAMFWNRFTSAAKYAVGAVVVVLLGLLIFVY